MSDQKLKQQKLMLDLYTSIKQIENQLDLIPTVSSAFIEAESVEVKDTDTYLSLTLPIKNHIGYIRLMAMNARDSLREYRQLYPTASNPIEADTRVLRYAIAIERFDTNYSAYCLDIPTCTAAGDTAQSAKQELASKLTLRLNQMVENGEEIPLPKTIIDYVDIDIPTS